MIYKPSDRKESDTVDQDKRRRYFLIFEVKIKTVHINK